MSTADSATWSVASPSLPPERPHSSRVAPRTARSLATMIASHGNTDRRVGQCRTDRQGRRIGSRKHGLVIRHTPAHDRHCRQGRRVSEPLLGRSRRCGVDRSGRGRRGPGFSGEIPRRQTQPRHEHHRKPDSGRGRARCRQDQQAPGPGLACRHISLQPDFEFVPHGHSRSGREPVGEDCRHAGPGAHPPLRRTAQPRDRLPTGRNGPQPVWTESGFQAFTQSA